MSNASDIVDRVIRWPWEVKEEGFCRTHDGAVKGKLFELDVSIPLVFDPDLSPREFEALRVTLAHALLLGSMVHTGERVWDGLDKRDRSTVLDWLRAGRTTHPERITSVVLYSNDESRLQHVSSVLLAAYMFTTRMLATQIDYQVITEALSDNYRGIETPLTVIRKSGLLIMDVDLDTPSTRVKNAVNDFISTLRTRMKQHRLTVFSVYVGGQMGRSMSVDSGQLVEFVEARLSDRNAAGLARFMFGSAVRGVII